jgi:PEP-CTERM motif
MLRSGAILAVLVAAPWAEADVIFDFSGTCQSGDCDPGSKVTAELRFTDDATLAHQDRAVTADDFVSLLLDFVTVHRARARAMWSPTTESTVIPPLEVTIDASGLLKGLLLRDELKNLFQVDELDGGWEYRQVTTAPDGTIETDLSLFGIEGAFAPRRSFVPEPAAPVLLGLGLASLAVRLKRAVPHGRNGGTGVRGSSG